MQKASVVVWLSTQCSPHRLDSHFNFLYSVNVFYRVGQEPETNHGERTRQEREFKIGSIGFADSLGILAASIFAVPTEVGLCNIQVERGKTLCKTL